jgi:hypothetical protein
MLCTIRGTLLKSTFLHVLMWTFVPLAHLVNLIISRWTSLYYIALMVVIYVFVVQLVSAVMTFRFEEAKAQLSFQEKVKGIDLPSSFDPNTFDFYVILMLRGCCWRLAHTKIYIFSAGLGCACQRRD